MEPRAELPPSRRDFLRQIGQRVVQVAALTDAAIILAACGGNTTTPTNGKWNEFTIPIHLGSNMATISADSSDVGGELRDAPPGLEKTPEGKFDEKAVDVLIKQFVEPYMFLSTARPISQEHQVLVFGNGMVEYQGHPSPAAYLPMRLKFENTGSLTPIPTDIPKVNI